MFWLYDRWIRDSAWEFFRIYSRIACTPYFLEDVNKIGASNSRSYCIYDKSLIYHLSSFLGNVLRNPCISNFIRLSYLNYWFKSDKIYFPFIHIFLGSGFRNVLHLKISKYYLLILPTCLFSLSENVQRMSQCPVHLRLKYHNPSAFCV